MNPEDIFGGMLPKEIMKMIMSGQGKVIQMEHQCGNALCPGYQEQPLFELGKIIMANEIKARLEKEPKLKEFIDECLGRHITGDGGDLNPNERVTHFIAIQKDRNVLSVFKMKEGKGKMFIVTKKDRTKTVILIEDDKELLRQLKGFKPNG